MTNSTGQRPRLRSRATRSEESYSCVQSDADEASDREAQPTSDPSSKKRKRVSNATTAQASTVPQEYIDLLPQRMPACYKSDQGNAFFTQKWLVVEYHSSQSHLIIVQVQGSQRTRFFLEGLDQKDP
jgi:hypothetical protein